MQGTKLKKGDNVVITAGKDKGKSGKIIEVIRKTNRVVVEGLNVKTRFQKGKPNQPGQKVQFPGSLDASNVMLMDPSTNEATRVGYQFLENGSKQRISKKSQKAL